jgi:hypothetical protein
MFAPKTFIDRQELFGDWARADDPFVKFPLVEHPPLQKSEGAILKAPVQNVVINIGWQGRPSAKTILRLTRRTSSFI